MSDERNEELASLYAFDLLEGGERAAFEVALAGDPSLRSLVLELRETSTSLVLAVTPESPRHALRARVLGSLAAQPSPRAPLLPFRVPAWIPWAAAAAFAAGCIYFSQLYLAARAEAVRLQAEFTLADLTLRGTRQQLEAERIINNRQLADNATRLRRQADLAECKIATLASMLGNSPEALAVAVWNPTAQEGVLQVQKLPALAADRDYQLWVIDPQYPIPVDGGVFTVDPSSGVARVTFHPNKPVREAAKFAISLERKGGVPKAEGPIVLLSH